MALPPGLPPGPKRRTLKLASGQGRSHDGRRNDWQLNLVATREANQ